MSIDHKTADTTLSPTARNARIETATETLAGYIGYLRTQIRVEEEKPETNAGRIAALEHQIGILLDERQGFDPDNEAMIDRAIYVYAPFLKAVFSRPA